MARLPILSISAAAAILGLCSLAVAEQGPPPAAPPAAPGTKTAPGGQPPAAKPPAVKPSEAPAPTQRHDFVGLDVFSSDGTRVGEVRAINTGPDGGIVALHVRTGGFLGFGGRIVSIPKGHFTRTGKSIRLDLDSDQVNGLPAVKE
jgi:sporulation protein YlmC with PRC-barrel domain